MLTSMTELGAVNAMLLSIGQAPVNTLLVSGIRDVNIAKSELTEMARTVQLDGWNWNTDDAYVLSPDLDGDIVVPPGVLKFEAADRSRSIVQRRGTKGLQLYDRDRASFTFAEPVSLKVVWGFPFDDLPETARSFIAIAACRKFQATTIGSRELDGFKAEDEQRAWATLIRDERGSRNTNLFRKNPRLANRAYGRSHYREG